MTDAARKHFEKVILPALRDYQAAEVELTAAVQSGDALAISEARELAERRARTASVELHHLADVVARHPPPGLPAGGTERQAEDWAEGFCTSLRGTVPVKDVGLLRDIADAYKHYVLRNPVRELRAASAMEVTGRGFGKGPFGEGKYGGMEQIWVLLQDGRSRPLSAVLQNATDAWRTAMGWPVPAISDFSE